jgi:hypothetical protein
MSQDNTPYFLRIHAGIALKYAIAPAHMKSKLSPNNAMQERQGYLPETDSDKP